MKKLSTDTIRCWQRKYDLLHELLNVLIGDSGMILKYTKTKTFSKVILTGLEAFSNLHESHLDFVLLFVIKHYWDEFIHCNLN